jgi:hypothetical protein
VSGDGRNVRASDESNPICPIERCGCLRAILGADGIVDARDCGGMIGSSVPVRRRAHTLVLVALVGALSLLIATVLVGPTPSALLNGEGEPNQTPVDHGLAIVPDLIVGHTGWCAYQRTPGGGACTPVAAPVPTEPAESGQAVCGFQPVHFAGLAAHWGEVVTALPVSPASADAALLSCASSWYSIRGDVLLAAILLDAHNPDVAAPAPPMLSALHDRPGIFTVAASGLAMRRIGTAWLAVQGGTLPQRLTLIRLLHASGSILTPRSPLAASKSSNHRPRLG